MRLLKCCRAEVLLEMHYQQTNYSTSLFTSWIHEFLTKAHSTSLVSSTVPVVMKMAERRIRRPRVCREWKNILNIYDDAELVKRYKLDRAGILLVTDLVRDAITLPTN